jgi:DME family drug/metabolite transporter
MTSLSGLFEGGASTVRLSGLLASAVAGASYAGYAVVAKALLDRGYSPAVAIGSIFGVAGVLALPCVLLTGVSWLGTTDGLLLVGWLGVVTVAVAYLLFVAGLRGLSASTVSTLTLAEPLTAALLGVWVLGERLSAWATAGLVTIGVGVAVLAVSRGPMGQSAANPT